MKSALALIAVGILISSGSVFVFAGWKGVALLAAFLLGSALSVVGFVKGATATLKKYL